MRLASTIMATAETSFSRKHHPQEIPFWRGYASNGNRKKNCLAVQSPFFPVLGGVIESLPEPLRDQYLVRPADPYRVVLEGTMDRIWHRTAWLWPFFRLLALFDILLPEQGTDIKASMAFVVLFPGALFQLFGMPPPSY